jgi:peptidoglycan/LPS O-acetylase OafA/YrhL
MMLSKPETLNKPVTRISEVISQKYFPSLNGLRGISIIIVVMCHLNLVWNFWYLTIFNGPLGVCIFFVLSGFLITTLCLKEQKQAGSLSLKNFYIRRVLRILPVAYLYVFVVFLLDQFFNLQIPWFQYLGAIFFVNNVSYFRSHHDVAQLGHYWSLSVEEQFYIIFPFILKWNRKVFFWCLLFIIIVLPILCTLAEVFKSIDVGVIYYFTHYFIKFQAIAVGCLLAILAFNGKLDNRWFLSSYKVAGNLIAVFLIFYLSFDSFYSVKSIFINLIIAILIAYIVISNIVPSEDFIYRFLNYRFLSLIGILSYSIYIWQQVFIIKDDRLPRLLNSLPFNLIFLAIVSSLSYFFYEKYFLKLKTKFSRLKANN